MNGVRGQLSTKVDYPSDSVENAIDGVAIGDYRPTSAPQLRPPDG
jgi:hypothetical protein